MQQRLKTILLSAGVLALTTASAAAAVVTNDLNLRSGPGTQYGVITSMPAGARVDVGGCRGNWCQVNWRGRSGYASASYLSGEGGTVRRAVPRYRTYSTYDSPYYYGPGYRTYGYGPGIGLSFSFGGRDYDRRRGRHHRRHR